MCLACSLEYNPQAGPTKFMIGTEQGNIMTCNRKAKNPQDRVGASFPGLHLTAVFNISMTWAHYHALQSSVSLGKCT